MARDTDTDLAIKAVIVRSFAASSVGGRGYRADMDKGKIEFVYRAAESTLDEAPLGSSERVDASLALSLALHSEALTEHAEALAEHGRIMQARLPEH
jgi:hypothetical protein